VARGVGDSLACDAKKRLLPRRRKAHIRAEIELDLDSVSFGHFPRCLVEGDLERLVRRHCQDGDCPPRFMICPLRSPSESFDELDVVRPAPDRGKVSPDVSDLLSQPIMELPSNSPSLL
jgi:hypothetical protein